MNCHEVRQHWNLYHDSEGEAEQHFQVNEHLAICPDCAQWFSQQSRLESLLADKLRAGQRTPELWNQVLARSGLTPGPASRRGAWLTGLAACMVALAMIGWWYLSRSGQSSAPDLAHLSAAWHERLESGTETPPFHSTSDLEVESYLRKQVTFPVRCPPRQDAGFQVRGAGTCQLAEQPAAYLVGQVDRSPVSIFVLPQDSLSKFPRQQEAVRKEATHRCREKQYTMVMRVIDRNAVLVIGQTDSERLEKVLSAYGTYPHHP
jgi:anti-sigma factor RsiW